MDRAVAEDEMGLACMERAGEDHRQEGIVGGDVEIVGGEVRRRSHVKLAARVAADVPALRIAFSPTMRVLAMPSRMS